jgi:hypothetical protein
MPSPILVGSDPRTADRAPVRFGAADGLRGLLTAPAQATA